MVNANLAPDAVSDDRLMGNDIRELRLAVRAGDYEIPAGHVAEAVLSWHLGLAQGRLSHEVAALDASLS